MFAGRSAAWRRLGDCDREMWLAECFTELYFGVVILLDWVGKIASPSIPSHNFIMRSTMRSKTKNSGVAQEVPTSFTVGFPSHGLVK